MNESSERENFTETPIGSIATGDDTDNSKNSESEFDAASDTAFSAVPQLNEADHEGNSDVIDMPFTGSNSTGASMGALDDGADNPEQKPVVDKIREAVPAVGQTASSIVSRVQTQAMSRLDEQKSHAAGELSSVAEALRKTGVGLLDNNPGVVANYASQYTETAAQQVEKISGFLKDKDINQIVVEVEDFARREPGLFIAGAFLLGLASARFLRATPITTATSSEQNADGMSGSM